MKEEEFRSWNSCLQRRAFLWQLSSWTFHLQWGPARGKVDYSFKNWRTPPPTATTMPILGDDLPGEAKFNCHRDYLWIMMMNTAKKIVKNKSPWRCPDSDTSADDSKNRIFRWKSKDGVCTGAAAQNKILQGKFCRRRRREKGNKSLYFHYTYAVGSMVKMFVPLFFFSVVGVPVLLALF